MDDCIFCKDRQGRAADQAVYEDDTVIALMTFAAAPVHTPIVPKSTTPTRG
jgi:diadenosine tetraphosphate (Ap4A) HIT family hydrolase